MTASTLPKTSPTQTDSDSTLNTKFSNSGVTRTSGRDCDESSKAIGDRGVFTSMANQNAVLLGFDSSQDYFQRAVQVENFEMPVPYVAQGKGVLSL